MSLASRLSAFFLGALAAVLMGFSATLYVLASNHLHGQADERLDAGLTVLAAAAEVGPRGLEWEPSERELGLGRDAGPDQIRWIVLDESGREVDRSANLEQGRLWPVKSPVSATGRFRDGDGRPWRTKSRHVMSPARRASTSPEGAQGVSHIADENDSGPAHAGLNLVVFAPLAPTAAILRRLALTLTALSIALWVAAAVLGRRLCRRALAPLTRMALAARQATDPRARLPLPGTNDELEGLGRAFNGLLDRLHEALERQRRFSGDASHQLRTPLAGLLSQVDVALRRERTPQEYRRVLGVVRAKAAELRQIVESLLFLARAESESGRPELELVDLVPWTSAHLDGWSAHPRAGDIQLAYDGAGPLCTRAHPPLLSQLVDNLLENACKYSPPGTPIEIFLARERDLAVLAVQDQGRGLATEEQSKVFEPFYRTPDAQTRGQNGVGLGLAVAERIARVFGGALAVESTPGKGSRFEVRLPIAVAAHVGGVATQAAAVLDR
jgi:signal transduction histidine kinase